MKIVQIGPYPISKECIRGGVESSVYGLSLALSKKDNVYVIDYPRLDGEDKVEVDGNITIYRYANPFKHNKDAVKRTNEILIRIQQLNPDVVHIHGTGLFSYRLYKELQYKNVKLMLTVHGLIHVEKKNALKRKFSLKHLYQYIVQSNTEFRILNTAKQIIVDTGYVAEQIKQCYNERKICHLPQMCVIPQGINEHYLTINSNPNSKVILSVGSISRRKGHLLLLQAFDKVCEQIPDAKLIIAGVLAEREYYEELQNYIKHSPYIDNIQLLINLPQDELYALYQHASVYALHSQEESQGIALVEAMATRLPIVSTNVGGIPYVVKEWETGILVNYGDIDSYAKHLITLMKDYKQYNDMSNFAVREAQRYVWSNIADEVVKLYKEIQ